jgi:solute carrier family 10 (sodium/bile acid cotransporter), member 7
MTTTKEENDAVVVQDQRATTRRRSSSIEHGGGGGEDDDDHDQLHHHAAVSSDPTTTTSIAFGCDDKFYIEEKEVEDQTSEETTQASSATTNSAKGEENRAFDEELIKRENEEEEEPPNRPTTAAGGPNNNNGDGSTWASTTTFLAMLTTFYRQYEFLLLILLAIGLARIYPTLGAVYLYPQITASWLAITIIFLLTGLSLPTTDLFHTLSHWRFHVFVQLFSFGVASVLIFGVARTLYRYNVLGLELFHGMTLVGTLPMTINSAYVLTRCANGDEAAALLNSVVANMLGIFLSPVLLLLYVNVPAGGGGGSGDDGGNDGTRGRDNFVTVFIELALRVILPTAVGQILQKTTNIQTVLDAHKVVVNRVHMFAMMYMVYSIFCKTFYRRDENNNDNSNNNLAEIFLMIACQLVLLVTLMILAWYALFWAPPPQRVFGLFGCTHKSMAIGILLVDAVFGHEPRAGLYALPLLVYHPLQLVLGTMVVPRLERYVKRSIQPAAQRPQDEQAVRS